MILPTAEPFFIPGGSVGILLVHGFTGTPKEMRWMGEYLAGKGYSVFGVRLAGHATQPKDLTRVRWHDWLASVEDGYHLLKGVSEDIIIAGLSLGGVLILTFAAQFQVSGVIAMSTPYALPPDPRIHFLPVLWRIKPTVRKGKSDWQDPTPAEDHIDYPHYVTRAIIEIKILMAEMQSALPLISAPALLIHSKKDGAVPYSSMEKIFKQIGSRDKEMFTIENSGHVIIRDAEKERVFEAAHHFIQRVATTQT